MDTNKIATELAKMAKELLAVRDVVLECEGTNRGYELTVNVRAGSGEFIEEKEMKSAVDKASKIVNQHVRDLKKIKSLDVKHGKGFFAVERGELFYAKVIELTFRDASISNEVINTTHELGYKCPL